MKDLIVLTIREDDDGYVTIHMDSARPISLEKDAEYSNAQQAAILMLEAASTLAEDGKIDIKAVE